MSDEYAYINTDCGRLSEDFFKQSYDDYEKVLRKMRVIHIESPDRIFMRTQGRFYQDEIDLR